MHRLEYFSKIFSIVASSKASSSINSDSLPAVGGGPSRDHGWKVVVYPQRQRKANRVQSVSFWTKREDP